MEYVRIRKTILESKFIQWLIAFILALIIGGVFIVVSVYLAINYYEERYPPVIGEDDLGAGIAAVTIFSLSVLCSIPIIGLSTWVIRNKLKKHLQSLMLVRL